MKIQGIVALGIGLGLGAAVMQALHAETKPPVYVVTEIDEITDAEAFNELRKTGPANIVEVKDADGRYVARTENITALDGVPPKLFIIVRFDNVKKAMAFNENRKATVALRRKATKSRSFLVEGL